MGLGRFKRFKDTDKGFSPKVSIWHKGQIWFSSGAVNKFKLTQYTHIVFLYDDLTKNIAFLFTADAEEEGAVKLANREKGMLVSAKNFLDCNSIDYKESKYYILQIEEEPNLFFIDLHEWKLSPKRTRKKKQDDGEEKHVEDENRD